LHADAEAMVWALGHVVLPAFAIAGAGVLLLRVYWFGVSAYRIRRAGPRRLFASRHRLWKDRGPIDRLDLRHGPGGADGVPAPPFAFVDEPATGSQPCVSVRDAHGRKWRVKWGHEVRCEAFAVRLVWACGYFAEITHLLPSGSIEGATNLSRARQCVDAAGQFVDARFEREEENVRTLFEEHSWAWHDNPFVGTRELDGLKILVMLLSNWDSKDRRDVARGSNTAIFEHRVSPWRREARYLITDWGGSMGRWGSNIVTRGRWDVEGFAAQTPEFVTGVRDGYVTFGYTGQRTTDVAEGIRVDHARWFARRVGRITDAQLVDALLASGAAEDEAGRFARAIRQRIDLLAAAVERA
jgi:hypothetical protein